MRTPLGTAAFSGPKSTAGVLFGYELVPRRSRHSVAAAPH
jgi:hypothetical protein